MTKLVFLEKKPRLFDAVVTVQVPGIEEPQQFTATFLDTPRSALRKEMEDENADQRVASVVLKNWEGIEDEDGKEVPYTPENLDVLLDRPYIALAVAKAYYDAILGRDAGNLLT